MFDFCPPTYFGFFACLWMEHVDVWLSYCMIGKLNRQTTWNQEKEIAKLLHPKNIFWIQQILLKNSQNFSRKYLLFWIFHCRQIKGPCYEAVIAQLKSNALPDGVCCLTKYVPSLIGCWLPNKYWLKRD